MHTFSIGYTVLLQAIHFSCVPANINDAFVGALVCCISTGNYEYIKTMLVATFCPSSSHSLHSHILPFEIICDCKL
jgi:hypothetical protein